MSTNKEKGIQQLLKINVDITSDVACPWYSSLTCDENKVIVAVTSL